MASRVLFIVWSFSQMCVLNLPPGILGSYVYLTRLSVLNSSLTNAEKITELHKKGQFLAKKRKMLLNLRFLNTLF